MIAPGAGAPREGGGEGGTLKHGTAFRSAVEAGGNTNVDWVVCPDEGHGWRQLASNEDFRGRAERLLAQTIGTEPSPAAATPAPATGGQ